jgi:phenylpropionate dioxygenase-like ring-hydroxylating dioxygenase large terminal subunit
MMITGQTGNPADARPLPRGSLFTLEETYRSTRPPVDRAMTLNPDAYRSPDYYDVERQRVFSQGWVCVGYTAQLAEPGAALVATVAGQPILLTCDKAGKLHAFYNVCRHRGSMLVAENGRHDVIRCPYHSWGYALDGRLLGAPYFKGLDIPESERAAYELAEVKGFRKEDYGLLPVRVDTWGCFVFVNLDPEARPLEEWLGDLDRRLGHYPFRDLRLWRRQTIEVQANWKLIAENFMEYYHLPWVHPELNTVSSFDNHERFQGPGLYTGMCTTPLARNPDLPIDLGVLPTMPGLNARDAETAYWILIVPNLALFLLPHHLFTLLYRPDGVGRTIEYADLLVHPDVLAAPGAEAKFAAIFAFWDTVNAQDIAAVERVQKGLAALAYSGGRMCFRFEESIHRFQNLLIDLMTGQPRTAASDQDLRDPHGS